MNAAVIYFQSLNFPKLRASTPSLKYHTEVKVIILKMIVTICLVKLQKALVKQLLWQKYDRGVTGVSLYSAAKQSQVLLMISQSIIVVNSI